MTVEGPAKQQNDGAGGTANVPQGSSVRVLRAIDRLYESGLSEGVPGAVGLLGIAGDSALAVQLARPKKKIRQPSFTHSSVPFPCCK